MDHKQQSLATEHDSSRTLTENVKNNTSNANEATASEHQLSTISISSSYWEQTKYSAFDLVRQQSLNGTESGSLGWSQDIVKH